jgi:hypothetical protein
VLPRSEAFRGLHRLPLPTWRPPLAAYYVGVLERSPQYAGLAATLAGLADAERREGEGAVQRHFDVLKHFFAGQATAFAALAAMPADPLVECNDLPRHRGETLLQVDLQEANYQVLALHGGADLPPTWADLCAALGVPAWFAASKLRRQQLLGLFDPKAQARAQRHHTAAIVAQARAAGLTPVFVSHDELIAAGPDPGPLAVAGVRVRQRRLREELRGDVVVRTLTPLDGAPAHRTLFAVPRHLFFRRFRELVLGEPATELDDVFNFEGALCLRLGDARLAELARRATDPA